MTFTIASSVDDALALMSAGARPIAGGTDLVVGARQGKADLPESLVAIDRLDELQQIESTPVGVRIGAGVTHSRLMTDALIVADYTGLADSAALIGSPATRNVGTIGGNVMNGSPAMDTGAPLVVLGAVAELASTAGTRQIGLDELWTGPGQVSARSDELCTAIVLPSRSPDSGSAYVRLEYRRAMEIAVVGAAASVVVRDGALEQVRIALTAVAPTIIEVPETSELTGREVDQALLGDAAELAAATAMPITDLRASERYRRHAVGVMASRAVDAAIRRTQGESIAVPVNRAIGIGAAS